MVNSKASDISTPSEESKTSSIRRSLEKLQRSHVRSKLLGRLTTVNKDQDEVNGDSSSSSAYPSSEATGKIFEEVESSISTDGCSFQDGDTPLSKTKKSHGFHFWIEKIHFYQKQKFYHIFGYVDKEQYDEQIKSEQLKDYEETGPSNTEQLADEDAFSCYNQFKTQNFNTFFETLAAQDSETTEDEPIEVPIFSPLNQLTYQDLKKLKEKVYGVPQFSAESLTGLVSNLKADGEAQVDSESILSVEKEVIGSDEKKSVSTSDIITRLFDGIQSGNPYDVDSSDAQIIDDISVSKPETDSLLTPIEVEPTSSLQRTRSVIERMKAVFISDRSSAQANTSRSTSTSSYSPVSIVVPALKNHDFIVDLAGDVLEGNVIEPIYHPNDDYSASTEDENTPIDIRNSSFYELPSENNFQGTVSSAKSTISATEMTTIKFDKFAQLLFYDGSKRLGHAREKSKTLKSPSNGRFTRREDYFKNRGSLVLSTTNSENAPFRLKGSKIAKLSKFATIGSRQHQLEHQLHKYISTSATLHSPVTVKPILKSRHNQNAETETIRAKFCDAVEVDDFMSFFETHEKTRQENEPYLERVREKQLMTYYSSESTV